MSCFFLFVFNQLFAQNVSVFQSQIIINSNGNEVIFDGSGSSGNESFNDKNLGIFACSSTLLLNGGEAITQKNGGCEISTIKLAYRIYLQGSTILPAFSEIELPNNADLGTCFNDYSCQKWRKNNAGINLLSGLSNGVYKIEVYFVGTTQSCSVERFYDTNFNRNYTATFTIENPISVTNQSPSTQSVCYGSNAVLSATSTGADSFYWQKKVGNDWLNISNGSIINGATTTLNLVNVTATEIYQCVFTNCGGLNSLISNPMTVSYTRPMITSQPIANQSDCLGLSTRFIVNASGSKLTFQWQRSVTGTFSNILLDANHSVVNTTTSSNLLVDDIGSTVDPHGSKYKCIITDEKGCTNTSDISNLLINTVISANDPIVCTGSTASLSTTIQGTATGFQWQKKTVNTWNDVSDGGSLSGANTQTLKITNIGSPDNGNDYRCKVTFSISTPNNNCLGATATNNLCTTATCVYSPTLVAQQNRIALINSPIAPTANNVSRCGIGSVKLKTTTLLGEKEIFRWYESATSTAILSTKDSLITELLNVGIYTYYLSIYNSNTTCESSRIPVTVTIKPLPTIMLADVLAICNAETSFNLPFSETSNSPDLYSISASNPELSNFSLINNAPLGSSPINIPIPSNSAAGNYQFAISVTNSTTSCISEPQNFSVKINETPYKPTVISPVNYCQNQSSTALTATAIGTNSLFWYGTNAIGGIAEINAPIPNSTIVGSTTYYLSQKSVDNCESLRAEIFVKINENPTAPTTNTDISYCNNAVATSLIAIPENSNSLIWYDENDNVLTSSPTPNTGIIGTQVFKVSQKTPFPAGCEGIKSIISLKINANPTIPLVNSPIGYCQNALASKLSATPTNTNQLIWYGTSSTGGTSSLLAPIPSTNLSGKKDYYVSQKDENSCESFRAKIEVDVTPTLMATIAGINAFCITGILNNSTTLTTNPIGGNGTFTYQWQNLAGNIETATNQTYIVFSQNANTDTYKSIVKSGFCTTSATLTVNKQGLADTPNVTGNLPDLCVSGSKTLKIDNPNAFGVYKWFSDENSLAPIALGTSFTTPILSETSTFYVVREANLTANLVCQTERKTVIININSIPAKPEINNSANKTTFCNSDESFTLNVSCNSGNGQYRLNSSSWIAGNSVTINPSSFLANTTITYDFKCVLEEGCESNFSSAIIKITSSTAAPIISGNTSFCEGTSTILIANGCAGDIIWSNGISASSITVSSAGTYQAKCFANNCMSFLSDKLITSVNSFPTFSKQPLNQTNCKGNSQSFSATVNSIATLQWEYRKTNNDLFSNVGTPFVGLSRSFAASNIGSSTYPNGSEFRLKATSNSCISYSDIAVLKVNTISGDIPDLTICSAKTAIFDLENLTINGTISSYEWEVSSSAGSGFIAVSGSQFSGEKTNKLVINPVSSIDGNKYYRCKIVFTNTVSGACTIQTLSGKLTVTTIPPPVITGSNNICEGDVTTLTASGCIGTVKWNNGLTGSMITVSLSGAYKAKCLKENCESDYSNEHILSINDLPNSPKITSNDTDNTICQGEQLTLTSSECAGTVFWSNSKTSNEIIVSTAGTYSAQCIVNNCLSEKSPPQIIVVNNIPAPPIISGNASICFGTATILTANGCNGFVRWNFGSTNTSISVSSSGTYTVSCTENDCESEVSRPKIVTVRAVPAAPLIKGSLTICKGSAQILTANGCYGTISWNTGDLGSTLSVLSSGTYTATCTENECTSLISPPHIISENQLPNIRLDAILPICNSATEYDLSYLTKENSPDKYSLVSTMPDFDEINEAELPESPILINIPQAKSGIFVFTLTLKNTETGCVNSQPFDATILPPLIGGSIENSSSTINCSGYNAGVISSINLAGGGKIPYEYQWQSSINRESFIDITNAKSSSYDPPGLTQTTYFRRITKDACEEEGFSDNIHQIIIVSDPQISITDATDKTLCSGGEIVLNATILGGAGTCAITWQSSNSPSGMFINEQNGGFSFTKTILNDTYLPQIKYFRAIYVCSGIGSSACNQAISETVKVTIHPIPNPPTISPNSAVLCSNQSIKLIADGCNGTVIWDGNQSGSTLMVTEAGTYSATCTVNNCMSTMRALSLISEVESPINPPIISSSTVICKGNSANLEASGCTGIVVWSNGMTGVRITVSPSLTTNYTAICTDGICISAESNQVIVTLKEYPIINQQPKSQADCRGNSVTFLVNASTSNSYQWQRKITNENFENIPYAIANTLTITDVGSISNPNLSEYRIIIANDVCAVTSTAAILTVNNVSGSIDDQYICGGNNVTFDLDSIRTTGIIQNYQWQKRVSTSGTWNDILEERNSTLIINNASKIDAQYYRCKINFSAGSSTCARYTTEEDANGAKLMVYESTMPIISGNNAICLGKSTKLTASNCNGNLTWSSGQTTPIITVSPIETSTYTVICTSNQCDFVVESAPFEVKVNATPIPENATFDVIFPEKLTFKAIKTIINGKLKWYNKATNGTFDEVPPSYSSVGSYIYWVTQLDSITTCESSRLQINAKLLDYFHITKQPSTQADCKGNSVYMDVTAVGPNANFTYQWQRKRPNEAEFLDLLEDGKGIKGWFSKTMSVSNVGNQDNPHLTQYRCIVRNGDQFLTSESATLKVNSVVGSLPNLGICIGGSRSFNLQSYFIITGNIASYQWQFRSETNGIWTNLTDKNGISGSNKNVLKFNNVTFEQGVYYRCLIKFNTEDFECTEPTDAAKLIVSAYPPAPLVNDVFYCQNSNASKLKVNSSFQNLVWYNQKEEKISDLAPTPSTSLAGKYKYYVADQTDEGCEGPKAAINVEIGALPPNPINTTPNSVSEGTILTFSAENSSSESEILRWYNSATGTTFSTSAPTFSAIGKYTRYVAQLSKYSCLGSRLAISASIIPILKFSKQPTSQVDCDGNAVVFSVTAISSNDISYQWQRQKPTENVFSDILGETTKSLNIANVGDEQNPNLSKYRCVVNDEKSTIISDEATLTVNEIKGKISNINLCFGKKAKLSFDNLLITGKTQQYQWQKKEGNTYTNIQTNEDGTALVNEMGTYRGRVTFLVSDKSTCVQNTNDIKIETKPIPLAPQVIDKIICQNSPFNLSKSVIFTNTTIWYDSKMDTLGKKAAPQLDVSKVGKNTFYVSQINQFACESERKSFEIIVSPIPANPLTTDVQFCRNAPSTVLNAIIENENQLVWYESFDTKISLIQAPLPETKVDGQKSYFVSAKNATNCESSREELKVKIVPCIATFENNFNNCSTVSSDKVNGQKWYDLYDSNGLLYVSVNPNGENLGKVLALMKYFEKVPFLSNKMPLMPRYIDFQSMLKNKFVNPVFIRIYYKNSEFEAFKTATKQPNLTINDFVIVHYDGVREDCDFQNNDNFLEGKSEVIDKNVIGKQVTDDFFYVEFQLNSFSEIGVTIENFTKILFSVNEIENQNFRLNWETSFEINAEKFIIERSTDCENWISFGEVKANGLASSYEMIDYQPLSGKNCYRLIYLNNQGFRKYSETIEVNLSDLNPKCLVFSNPISSDDVNVYLRNFIEKEIKIYNLLGQEQAFNWKKDERGIIRITPKENLKGVYVVDLIDEKGTHCTQKIVINR